MFHSSTTFIPAQYLTQIQAHQRQLRTEAEHLALVARHRHAAKIRGRVNQRTATGVFARLRIAIARG